ncbi:MAG: aminoglycoside phosphotransferase family protein [Phenylobacterium sp.]
MSPPEIDEDLVRRLVAAQFPQWADLPVLPVSTQGWDNRTFRLGEDYSVRLPSAAHYVAQVEKEQIWLPRLAPGLPLPIAAPVGMGAPGEGYPFPWSVNRWLEGDSAANAPPADAETFARDLARFLNALRGLDAANGPAAGRHSFHRGGSLHRYDTEFGVALDDLKGAIDRAACERIWAEAMASAWEGSGVWVHGDVAAGNLLIRDGRLSAVIDFGQLAVGDPACDLVIAWVSMDGAARTAFRGAVGLDASTWSRARGWALWKALVMITGRSGAVPGEVERHRRALAVLLAS